MKEPSGSEAGRRYDAIVIGAGMSGLAAGIRLAQFDRRVVVLERHSLWGGLNSFYKLAGRRFDVGLHALTNFAPPRTPGVPLTRILKQLRLRHADLRLGEHHHSEILFPGERLEFSNDPARLEEEVARAFPAEIDGFRRLVERVRSADADGFEDAGTGARAVVTEEIRDPLLVQMLMLPVLYYGSPTADDIAWTSFVVLFRSIFLEGLSRPEGGIRSLLELLLERLKANGGELRLRSGVQRVVVNGGVTRGVVLEDGTELEADTVISSAGWAETMRLAGTEVAAAEVGRLTFLESISVLDRTPADLGYGAAVAFFATERDFRYREPATPVDLSCGVLSAPNNFASATPMPEGLMRVTIMANHAHWSGLGEQDYRAQKERAADDAAASAIRAGAGHVPDWRPHTVFRDVFTPRTIEHFTGHAHGAVYGSPKKRRDGETGIPGLVLCGTDQGWLGVTGAMMSGIAMANRHVLAPTPTP